jgi:hypothetical protein
MLQTVENQFNAAGYTQFVEHAEQVISDGVLAQVQLPGNLAVRQSFSNQANNILFSFRKQAHATGVLEVQRHGRAQGIEQVAKLLAIGPHLALMDGMNAFAKSFERLVAEDYALRAEPECVNHQLAFPGIEQHDRASPHVRGTKFAQDVVALERSLLQLSADHRDIGLNFLQEGEGTQRIHRTGHHGHAIPSRPQRVRDKLTIHLIRFRDQNIYKTPGSWPLLHRPPLAATGVWKGAGILDMSSIRWQGKYLSTCENIEDQNGER